MFSTLIDWLQHPAFQIALGCFSLVALLATLVMVPRFVVTLPVDFLQYSVRPPVRHPLVKLLRNVLGVLLILLGVLMLILPGPGLMVLLVGLLFLDFPRKRIVILRLMSQPGVLTLINKLRQKRGHPPIER
jgi:hypothetical protein